MKIDKTGNNPPMDIGIKQKTIMQRISMLLIWCIFFYSEYYMYVVGIVKNSLQVLGAGAILFFALDLLFRGKTATGLFPIDCKLLFVFDICILFAGAFFAPDKALHFDQWGTIMAFSIITAIITAIAGMTNKIDGFIWYRLIITVFYSIVFIINPQPYLEKTAYIRYTLDSDLNPNFFSFVLVIAIWAALYFVLLRKLNIFVGLALASVFYYCIIQTGSRLPLVAGILCIAGWVFLYMGASSKRDPYSVRFLRTLLMIVISVVAIVILYNVYKESFVSTRMDVLVSSFSDLTRLEMYQNAWALFRDFPIFGIGADGYRYYYETYSHATWPELLVSGGVIGTLAFLAICIVSLIRIIKLLRITRHFNALLDVNRQMKMALLLWVTVMFYSTGNILFYTPNGFVAFAIIFSLTIIDEKKVQRFFVSQKRISEHNTTEMADNSLVAKGDSSVPVALFEAEPERMTMKDRIDELRNHRNK